MGSIYEERRRLEVSSKVRNMKLFGESLKDIFYWRNNLEMKHVNNPCLVKVRGAKIKLDISPLDFLFEL